MRLVNSSVDVYKVDDLVRIRDSTKCLVNLVIESAYFFYPVAQNRDKELLGLNIYCRQMEISVW